MPETLALHARLEMPAPCTHVHAHTCAYMTIDAGHTAGAKQQGLGSCGGAQTLLACGWWLQSRRFLGEQKGCAAW